MPVSRNRRDFVKLGAVVAAQLPLLSSLSGCATEGMVEHGPESNVSDASPGLSAFGRWRTRDRLPEFVVPVSRLAPAQRSVRHFHMLGNRAIQMQAGTDGTVGLYDESRGMRWLVYADDSGGTGTSTISEMDGTSWGSARSAWPVGEATELVFGSTWFEVTSSHRGLTLSRRILCPEGDVPWVFVEICLRLAPDRAPRSIRHTESWQLRPRFLHVFEDKAVRDAQADAVVYRVETGARKLIAHEEFGAVQRPIGPPLDLSLESLDDDPVIFAHDGSRQPLLKAATELLLQPGSERTLYFRVGRLDAGADSSIVAAGGFWSANLKDLRKRLPRAAVPRYAGIAHEISWHAAALSGGANRDEFFGGHTLNQGSVYAFVAGGNAAARDPLQHALPLIYSEPDLALSVLRNTCSWGGPDGDLPYGLTGEKQALEGLFRPSDQNLWVFWLAAEYGIATGDLAAFDELVPYHPRHAAQPVSLKTHLLRQYRFLVDTVGLGAGGHIRILNADWNDMALEATGVDPEQMKAEGGSVLNSAMAAWVLPVFAALLEKLGEADTAAHARAFAAQLRGRVAAAWNGRWFHRAYAPDGRAVGDDECWLEVQPWAILCGAADAVQARELLRGIDQRHRLQSPLGARLIWPVAKGPEAGMGTRGGIWYSVNMTLIWAASNIAPELAWDEWQRMSLHSHVRYLPERWEGTLGGPDAWNSPEAERPGQTWAYPWLSMQEFPVSNMHAHAQPLLAYLRLLGVQPNARGELMTGRGDFRSAVLRLDADGHGTLRSRGRVAINTLHGGRSGSGDLAF